MAQLGYLKRHVKKLSWREMVSNFSPVGGEKWNPIYLISSTEFVRMHGKLCTVAVQVELNT